MEIRILREHFRGLRDLSRTTGRSMVLCLGELVTERPLLEGARDLRLAIIERLNSYRGGQVAGDPCHRDLRREVSLQTENYLRYRERVRALESRRDLLVAKQARLLHQAACVLELLREAERDEAGELLGSLTLSVEREDPNVPEETM